MSTKTMAVKKEKKDRSEVQKVVFRYLKGLLVSLIVTFALIILFALIIKWTSLDDKYISPINMVIKALSVFLGAIVLTKGSSKGALQGILFAIIYTILSFTIFSILARTLSLGLGLLTDFGFAAAVGGIGGIIGVGIKKK